MRFPRRTSHRAPTRLIPAALAAMTATLATAVPATAQGWVLARSPNFVVVSDAGEKSARQVARRFEVFRDLFRSVINLRGESSRPLVVLALRNQTALDQLLPAHAKGTVAGMFVGGGDLHHIALRLDTRGDHPYSVVYHEYVHLLVKTHFRHLPLWLNEGMAEFYETAEVRETDVEFGQLHPRHVRLLREVTVPPLETLLAVDTSSPEYNERSRISIFYAQSAALTHYFLLGERGAHRAELLNYLTLVDQGVPEADARRQALGGVDKLDKAFGRYVNNLQFFAMRAPLRSEPVAAMVAPLNEADGLAVRAQFLVHYGAPAEAGALAEEALKRDPDQALAHEVRGRLLAGRGRTTEAIAELARAAELSPNDGIVQYRLGITVAPNEGEAGRARRERNLRRAVELQPRYAPARSALAGLLEQTGRGEEAVTHARAAMEAEPGESDHGLRLASALRAAGRAAEAVAVEQDLARAARTDASLLWRLAWLLRNTSRAAEAEALVRQVRAERPAWSRATTLLATLLVADERHDEAEAAYREALIARPDDPEMLNELAYLNADRNVRVAEALQLVEKALRSERDAPHLLDTRGWALFRLGRLAEAEKDLRRAVEGETGNAAMLDHLGDVLAARGARAEAQEHWRRALLREDLTAELQSAIEAKLAPPGQ